MCKPSNNDVVVGDNCHQIVESTDHAASEGEGVLKVQEEACAEGGVGWASCDIGVVSQDPVLANEDERDLSSCNRTLKRVFKPSFSPLLIL